MITSFILSFFCSNACLDARHTIGRQYTLRECLDIATENCADPDINYFYEDWRSLEMGAWVADDLPDSWTSVRKQIVYRDSIPGC